MSSVTEESLDMERMFEDEYEAQFGDVCVECGELAPLRYRTNCAFCDRPVCLDCAFYVGSEVSCEECFIFPSYPEEG